jgi:hypothetical protein
MADLVDEVVAEFSEAADAAPELRRPMPVG